MSLEGQMLDHKSLRAILGKSAYWDEIAKDCIAFANATGGGLLLGMEDGPEDHALDQHAPLGLPGILRRKLTEHTAKITLLPTILTAPKGGKYLRLEIARSMAAVVSTPGGRYYYLRMAAQNQPFTGDDAMDFGHWRGSPAKWYRKTLKADEPSNRHRDY